MLTRYIMLPILMCLFSKISLTAMDKPADGTVTRQTSQKSLMRKTQSSDDIVHASSEPRGSHTTTTKSHAITVLFPNQAQVKSSYFTHNTTQEQFLECLANLPWIKTKDVKVENNGENTSVTVTDEIDLAQLDALYKREVLEKEKPGIVAETRKEEQAKLSFYQKNPVKCMLMGVAIGASLPYALPMLIQKYTTLDK